MAQLQEKLIASVEAELDEDEIALEYSTSVNADSILSRQGLTGPLKFASGSGLWSE